MKGQWSLSHPFNPIPHFCPQPIERGAIHPWAGLGKRCLKQRCREGERERERGEREGGGEGGRERERERECVCVCACACVCVCVCVCVGLSVQG